MQAAASQPKPRCPFVHPINSLEPLSRRPSMRTALATSAGPAQPCAFNSSSVSSHNTNYGIWSPSQAPPRRQLRQLPPRALSASSAGDSGANPTLSAQPAAPLPPYYQLSLPVYSLATVGPGGASPTMNLVTYAAPISLKPRHYALGLYLNTLSWENMLATRTGVLQVRHGCGAGSSCERRAKGGPSRSCGSGMPGFWAARLCCALMSPLVPADASPPLSLTPCLNALLGCPAGAPCRCWGSSTPRYSSCLAAPAGAMSTSWPSWRGAGFPSAGATRTAPRCW